MRRRWVASAAGLAVVGTLVVPAILPAPTTLPTATAALPQPAPAAPRVIFTGSTSADSPDTAPDIWDVVAADATDQRMRVDSFGDAGYGFGSPGYSPDGTRAVFTRVVDDEGAEGQQLATADLTGGVLAPAVPLSSEWTDGTWDDEPDWSDDGSRIVFTRAVDEGTGETLVGQLRVVDEATGVVTDPLAEMGITHSEVFGTSSAQSPAWSPDGTRIAFTVPSDGAFDELWVLDLEDGLLLNVVATGGEPVLGRGATWSPDGSQLARIDGSLIGGPLVAGALGEPDAAAGTVTIDTEVIYGPVSTDPIVGLWSMAHPAWSPDGTEIAVVAQDVTGAGSPLGIFAVDVGAGDYRPISVASPVQGGPWGQVGAPDYQPWSDLAVELTATATGAIQVGDVVDLVATVTNDGPSAAWATSVEIELPGATEGLDLAVSWPAECSGDGGYRTCELTEPLAPGESVELTLSVAFTEPGGFTADARATADTPDPATADNVAAVAFEVDFPAATGIEPRLAFGYEHGTFADRRYDLADVLAADATDFRVLVDEVLPDDDGGTARPAELHPSYSPDGRQVVFSSERHELEQGEGGEWSFPSGAALFVGDVRPGPGPATNVRMLDYAYVDGYYDTDPVWSPDGSRIALRHGPGEGTPQLAVIDVGVPGAAVEVVVLDGWEEGMPVEAMSWAPDGERLVVDTGFGLWVVHLDDGVAHPVLAEVPDCGTVPGGCLQQVTGADPAWSPDGSQLAFTHEIDQVIRGLSTVAIGPAADEYVVPPPQLVAQISGGSPRLTDPAWSLDSGFITFVGRENASLPGTLLTVPATGGTPAVLRDTFPGATGDVADPVYQPWADVGVELSAAPGVVDRPFTVRATVTNDGPSPAWGTAVTIEVPALASGDAVLETWPDTCEPTGATLSCTLVEEALPVGVPVTIDVVLRVTEPGTYAVEADVTTRSVDPEQGDNADVLSIGVAALPDSVAQPHLAFTRQATGGTVDTSADVADVPAQGGPVDIARLLAHQSVTTVDGEVLFLEESHPSYSPDGTSLVFSATPLVAGSEGEYLAATRLAVGDLVPDPVPGSDAALTNIRFLDYDVDELAADEEPAWSPGGSQIAFTRSTDLSFGRSVRVLDVASGDVRELTPPDLDGVETMNPSWSPEGDRLVVEMRIYGEATELWIVHLDPAGDTWYPVGTVVPSCTGSPLECLSPWQGFAPAWSPDGRQLAVGDAWLYGDGPESYSAVEVLDIPPAPSDGFYPVGDSQVLVGTPTFWDGDLPAGQLYAAWHPAWSPDGTEISFVGRATAESYDAIAVVPAAGGEPEVRIAEWSDLAPGSYANPAYQPASGDVAITIDDPGVVVVDVPTDLTATVRNAGPGPAWGVTVTIALPPEHRVADLPAGCTVAGGVVTCMLTGAVPAGGEVDVTLTVAFGRTGPQQVTAEVTTSSLDPDPGDNSAVVDIDVQPVAPATGIEPRLAFSYVVDSGQQLPSDVADVFWADGEEFRVLADERITDPAGQLHRVLESDPSYSPDGRRLVLSAARTVASAGSGGYTLGEATLMVGDTRPGPTGLVNVEPLDYERPAGADDVDPAWSPDGSQIAFVRTVGENIWLALADVASGEVRYVEGLPYWIDNPSWSPDGERLIVDATDGQGSMWVVHVDPDGDEVFPVVIDGRLCEPDLYPCEYLLHEPSWSPDGTRVAFLDPHPAQPDEIVDGLFTVAMPVAPVAGTYRTGAARLVVGADPVLTGGTTLRSPAWSLDGTSLAFVGQGGEEESSSVIYTVPADGGTPEVLRDEVRAGVRHEFADLVYQPWADLGVTVTTSAPLAEVGEPVAVTVTATNHGPSPAWGVAVDVMLPGGVERVGALPAGCAVAADRLTCRGPDAMPVGASSTFTFTVEAATAGSHETVAEVTSRMIDPQPGNDTAAASFQAVATPPPPPPPLPLLTDVAVRLELGQPTGWVGGDPVTATVVVTNDGPGGAADVTVISTYPAIVDAPPGDACLADAPCDLGTLAAGESRTIVVELAPLEAGEGTVTAAVTTSTQDTGPANNSATADLEVRQPELRLLPSVATPGEAILAYGVDFPPGAQLTLEWSRGITAWIRPVTVREDGTVRVPLLLLRGDELGERVATAQAAGGPGFGDVEAPPMLVVPRNFSPPNFLTRG